MKAQKIILSLTVVLLSIVSYGQSKSTYSFNIVQKKDVKNNAILSEKIIGKDCTLLINKDSNTYTFSYKSLNGEKAKITFKITGSVARILGSDNSKKTEYKILSNLDNKGTISFVSKSKNNDFAYSFLNSLE